MSQTHSTAGPSSDATALALNVGAVATGAAVAGLIAQVGLPWWLKLAVLGVAALILPLAPTLSGRITAVAALLAGSSLLLWLIPVGFGLTHATLLAALLGGLAAGRAMSLWRRRRLSELRPVLAWVDALPVLAGLATAFVFRRPLLSGDVGNALAMTVARWDNSSHAYLAGLLHDHGRLQPFLGVAFDNTGYGFAEYPTGYHSLVATLMDLMIAPGSTDRGRVLLAFWHAVALLLVLVVAGCVAAVTATPIARRRPLVALVAATALAATFLLGPGLQPVADGHQNIPVTLLGAAAVFSSMLGAERVWQPVRISVATAGVVAAAGSWAPVGGLAGVGALAVLLPLRRARFAGSRREIAASAGIGLVGAAMVALIAKWATSGVAGDFLVAANGGVTSIDGSLLMRVAVGVAASCVAAALVAWSRRGGGAALRLAVLGAVPLGGLAFYAYLAHQQIAAFGELRYYATKFGVLSCLLGLVYLAFAALYLAPRSDVTSRPGSAVRTVIAAVLALVTLGLYGNPLPNPYFPGSVASGRAAIDTLNTQAERELLLAVLQASQAAPANSHVVVVSPSFGVLNSARYTVALESIRGTYTLGASDIINKTLLVSDPVTAATTLVRDNAQVVVVTDADTRQALVKALGEGAAGRVVSYQ